jgi:quinoprotein glucose dehydrogenase
MLRGTVSRLVPASALVALVVLLAAGARTPAQTGQASFSLPNPDSSNFMNFNQITKTNVKDLEVAWFYPYASDEFTPVVVDDVLYGLGRNNSLIALDAATGKEIWIHEGLNGINSNGINYWQSADGSDRRLIFAVNSYLQAIDARTGKSILTFGKNGIVDLREGLARAASGRAQPASPGRIWRNTLVLGGASGEAFITPPGDIRAYDVVTGRKVWQFHTIPLPGEFGYETNPKEGYKYIGGANNWGEMALDEARGIVYIPTGSATYDFYGADRHGANLFGNSILALDVRTGKRLWHFQTIHHDLWDLDNVSAPQLVTVTHNGQRVDVVAHAGKTGFLYVFNRVTGEPLWPIEERPVPRTDVPGEYSSPTQPFPTRPAPFVRQAFTPDDVNPWLLDPKEYAEMRARVARSRNGTGPQGGLFVPPAVEEDTMSMPGNQGGSNWGTTAASPDKGLVFVVGVNQVALLRLEDVKTRLGGRGGGQGGPSPQAGAALFREHCQICHGANLQGVMPGVPSLVGVTSRMSEDELRLIVTEGKGQMRPVSDVTPLQITAIHAFLEDTNPNRGDDDEEPVFPPGPVVGRGGAPRPTTPARNLGPFYPGSGGNAGNQAWPADVDPATLPPTRYMSGYNVMSSSTRHPYTTLTAYDLNTGEIRWQVPNGDDPQTVRRGGPPNTGGRGARNGILVTATGLVFHAGSDGKVRAYDEDSGRVLWEGTLAGDAPGIPAMYMARGRQYVVVAAPGEDDVPAGAARGYIALALPR